MEFETYERRPFPVQAVQVTPQNAEKIAAEINGEVVLVPTRLVGATLNMQAVKLPGKGENGKDDVAQIGSFIVKRNGSCRVYKAPIFNATFREIPKDAEANGEAADITDLEIDENVANPELETLTEEQLQSKL